MKKHIALILTFLFAISFQMTAFAGEIPQERTVDRIVDGAELISQSDVDRLNEKLDSYSEELDFDIGIVTVNSTDGSSPMVFADDYFDYNGFGMGNSGEDGVLLLISMEDRDWYISTSGFGITAISSDYGVDHIGERIRPALSDGDYAGAFDTFADTVKDFVKQAQTGEPYGYSKKAKDPFPFVKNILICLLIGIIVGLIAVLIMKGKLKTVRKNNFAADYVVNNSMKLTQNRDYYLYTRHTQRLKPQQNSSHSSGSHTSSSGHSHGGGGGHF